jgi:hypothetical protein
MNERTHFKLVPCQWQSDSKHDTFVQKIHQIISEYVQKYGAVTAPVCEAASNNGINPIVIYFRNEMTTDNSSHATSYNTKPDTYQIYKTIRISHDIKFISSSDSRSLCLPLQQYFIKPNHCVHKGLPVVSKELSKYRSCALFCNMLYFY